MPVVDPYGDPYKPVDYPGWGGPWKGPSQAPGPPPYVPPGVQIPQAAPAEQPYNAPDPYGPPKPPPIVGPGAPNFATDPGVAAATSAQNLGMAQATQSLTDARRQAIIRWGDPALAGMAGFGMDPQDAAFAKQNYLSGNADLARLGKAKEDRKRALINRLAGRGILFSGETGYEEGQNTAQYGQARYDAQNALLDYLRSLTDQNLQQQNALRQTTLQAYQSAYDRYANNPYAYTGYA